MKQQPDAVRLQALRPHYRRLLRHYGPQHWWPADTPFEVMVGAVLTQNTTWSNVERALARLKAGVLTPQGILAMSESALAQLIRSSGYHRVKARRLHHLCRFLQRSGGIQALGHLPTEELRRELLAVHGVGPETADAILLYAFERPLFVVDAYARRVLSRLELIAGDEPYEALRRHVEQAFAGKVAELNELHALLVQHAKQACRVSPRCEGCVLLDHCGYFKKRTNVQ